MAPPVPDAPLDAERLYPMLDELGARDPDLATALARHGRPPPRVREPGFATLLHVIVAQQLSTRSAAAIWRKLETALGGREVTPERFLALDEAALRACGFSGPKIGYGRGLAAAVAEGGLRLDALGGMAEEEAVAALTTLRGFGRWSAEIYLLFALGRPDVFPADDLALQVGYQRLKGLAERPTARRLRELTEPWRPFRGAGAVFLWHYYGSATLDETRSG